jgi:hypothetical protein
MRRDAGLEPYRDHVPFDYSRLDGFHEITISNNG